MSENARCWDIRGGKTAPFGAARPETLACPKTSVFGKLALRARANALEVNIFFEVMRSAPRPLRFGTRSRRTRYARTFSRASLSTFADTAKHIRKTEQTREICRADFFSQPRAVKKISPGARRFCLYSSNRFIRGAKPRPERRGLLLIRERGYLCRLAVIWSAMAYIIVTASSLWFNSFCTFFMSISFLNSLTA